MGLLCRQISSQPHQGAGQGWLFPLSLITKTLKSSAGQEGRQETNEDEEQKLRKKRKEEEEA